MRGVGQGAVGVAVEVERAAVRVVPDPKCLVAEDNQLLAALRVGVQHLQLVIVFDPVERVFHAVGGAVMVAANEPNRAVKLGTDGAGVVSLFVHENIAEMVDDVF